MFYRHFYRHLLSVDDKFLIWTFDGSIQHHKVKVTLDDHNVECFCPGTDIIICTDLNYINETWETAPVLSHGEYTASPPSWRQIEIGKYVRVQHLLQVATYAVMIGGAIILHKAGTAAQASMTSEPVGGSLMEQTVSRPMSIQEMSQMSSFETSMIAPADASVVQIEGEAIGSLNVSIDSQTFREVSSCSHSLSGLSEQVGSSFTNSVLIAPDIESEVVANLDNTFSESMFKPKSINMEAYSEKAMSVQHHKAKSIDLEGYQGEFAEPFTNKFVGNVDAGKTFFKNVLTNELQLSAETKDMVEGILLDIDVTSAVNKQVSKQVIAALENEIGGLKVFTNYTGSAKPTLPAAPPVTYNIQYYQGLVGASKIGSVTQTSVDKALRTCVTEMKREFLLQTSLDVDLVRVTSIQHLTETIGKPSFKFSRTNAPLVGHSNLVFDILNDSLGALPDIPLVLMVGIESYLVNGLYDGALWVYCNRDKLEEAGKHCKATVEDQIALVPQKRRGFACWMHVDTKVLNDHMFKVHDDVATLIKSSGRFWVINGDQRERRYLIRDLELSGKDLIYNGWSWPHRDKTFFSPFQFNGIEMLNVKGWTDVFRLPPICTLLPHNHVQLCVYDQAFQVCQEKTICLDYKKGDAFGFVCGSDYLTLTQQQLAELSQEWVAFPYRTLSFFSSYDFAPCRIKAITFHRPWVLFPSFWYMHIELHN